jgi:hypothetical protein
VTGPCIAIDADLIYERAVLARFISGESRDSILVGPGEIDDIESTKALVDGHGSVTKVVDKRLLLPHERPLFGGEAMGVLMFNSADLGERTATVIATVTRRAPPRESTTSTARDAEEAPQ